jgi:hypothetical protein
MPYEEQVARIRALCERAALSADEMADRAAIKRDSMRKISNGYQPASPQLLQLFRVIAENEELQRNQLAHNPRAIADERAVQRTAKLLHELARTNPRGYNVVANVIEIYAHDARVRFGPQREPGDPRYPEHQVRDLTLNEHIEPSSELPPGLAEGVEKALQEETAHGGEGSSPSGGAGGSNAPSQRPRDRTGPPSSSRRTSPGAVPKSRAGDKGGSGPHKK